MFSAVSSKRAWFIEGFMGTFRNILGPGSLELSNKLAKLSLPAVLGVSDAPW